MYFYFCNIFKHILYFLMIVNLPAKHTIFSISDHKQELSRFISPAGRNFEWKLFFSKTLPERDSNRNPERRERDFIVQRLLK